VPKIPPFAKPQTVSTNAKSTPKRMKFTKYIVILTLFTLISCVANRLIFHEKQASEFDKLDIQTVVKLERQKHSKDITPERLIGIGEGIYPNINKYVLATPKTYVINEMTLTSPQI